MCAHTHAVVEAAAIYEQDQFVYVHWFPACLPEAHFLALRGLSFGSEVTDNAGVLSFCQLTLFPLLVCHSYICWCCIFGLAFCCVGVITFLAWLISVRSVFPLDSSVFPPDRLIRFSKYLEITSVKRKKCTFPFVLCIRSILPPLRSSG